METEVGAIFEQGRGSIKIPMPIYIKASASVVGTKEGEGPFGELYDIVGRMINLAVTPGRKQRVPCKKRH